MAARFKTLASAVTLVTALSVSLSGQIDPGLRWVGSIGITKGNFARITMKNVSSSRSCSGHMKFLAPGRAIAGPSAASFYLMPGQVATLDLYASRVLAATSPLNERAEVGASVKFAEPPDTEQVCQCSIQAVHQFSGVTTAVGDGAIVPQ